MPLFWHPPMLPLTCPTPGTLPHPGCEASLSNTLKAVGLDSKPEGLKGVTAISAAACKVGLPALDPVPAGCSSCSWRSPVRLAGRLPTFCLPLRQVAGA